ncbi:MAG: hypothetical protein H6736_13730 [Alphaproteobacteria bacterium]|nr:hypothetical protein [Alphaproteobacteria bacterium]MCB9692866.1 hypothetical protein [Alphaproteobacteria bacterium]
MLVVTLAAYATEPPMDCTGKVTAVCNITNAVVAHANDEAGEDVLTQSSPKARLRPTSIYAKLLDVFQVSQGTPGCLPIGRAGGIYDRSLESWGGTASSGFFGAGSVSGTFDEDLHTFSGTGQLGPYGARFGVFANGGRIAASAGPSANLWAMGSWVRWTGTNGVFVLLIGQCSSADYADVFEDWYGAPLAGPVFN